MQVKIVFEGLVQVPCTVEFVTEAENLDRAYEQAADRLETALKVHKATMRAWARDLSNLTAPQPPYKFFIEQDAIEHNIEPQQLDIDSIMEIKS